MCRRNCNTNLNSCSVEVPSKTVKISASSTSYKKPPPKAVAARSTFNLWKLLRKKFLLSLQSGAGIKDIIQQAKLVNKYFKFYHIVGSLYIIYKYVYYIYK